jgi:endonuclease/exonuclease/phosphatase family metal-dependent hydrolase
MKHLLLATLLLAWPGWTSPVTTSSAAPPASPLRLRVVTYNIHHGEGTDGLIDLERIAALLSGMQPDLVALQEVDRNTVRSGGVDQFAMLEQLTGMGGAFGKAMDFDGGSYGVAVLSRLPLLHATSRPLPGASDREPRTDLTVDVEMRPGLPTLQFSSTHLDQGRDIASRLAQVRFLNGVVPQDDDQPAILAGDLNSQPDSAVVGVLHQVWSDMFTTPEPLGPQGVPRRRVDHVLARPASRWHTEDAQVVDDRVASDHRPVIVTLEWN